MSDETQLELDFVDWLARLSEGIEVKSEHWFEDEHGNMDEDRFCEDCAVVERDSRKHKKNQFGSLCGSVGHAHTSDTQPFCERCGTVLLCSPTEYMIEDDIEWLESADEIGASTAASIHEWLTGMGDYQRDKHWPKIKPHAKRLMKAAGVEIIPEGKIRFRPCDVTREGWRAHDSVWLSIYEYFARRLLKWAKGRGRLQFLNNTSSINNTEFWALTSPEDAHRNVADLLSHVGRGTERCEFLDSLGLKTLADLDKPIIIKDQRCDWPSFDVRGLKLKKPGPNECHPKALTVTNAELRFCAWNQRWQYSLFYDYTHYERSSWCISIEQADGQMLPEFMHAVSMWFDEVLEPRDRDDQSRSYRLREWDKVRDALETVFYADRRFGEDGNKKDRLIAMTDAIVGIQSSSLRDHRIVVDRDDRLQTVQRWIAEDVAALEKKGGT